jgi:hypothetical protein
MSVGSGSSEEPRTVSPSPHLLYIVLCDGSSLAMYWARHPQSGREVKAQVAVGPAVVEINLTFSPLISTYTLNFILKLNTHLFSHSITDQCIEYASSSWSVAIRLTTTIHLSVLKQILKLHPYCPGIINFSVILCWLSVL